MAYHPQVMPQPTKTGNTWTVRHIASDAQIVPQPTGGQTNWTISATLPDLVLNATGSVKTWNFTTTGKVAGTSARIDFGDNLTMPWTEGIQHIYAGAGTYLAKLKVDGVVVGLKSVTAT